VESYRTQLHHLVAAFESRRLAIPEMVKDEAEMVPRAVRALTLRRYAISRRDKIGVRLQYILEAHRMLDMVEGREVGPTHLPENHSRPGESRRRRAVPGA
jgi:hypothetical protein